MPFRPILYAFLLFVSMLGAAKAQNDLQVVTSIKPIHSLVSMLGENVFQPYLMAAGGDSVHHHRLKPQSVQALQNADLIFWVGENLETYLTKTLKSLAIGKRAVALNDSDGIELLPLRTPHDSHAEDHHDDDNDAHIWLDPLNAMAMLDEILRHLLVADEAHAKIYIANATKAKKRLQALHDSIALRLKPVSHAAFITYHDAYQYFENRFGLHYAGSLSRNPEVPLAINDILHLQEQMEAENISCMFFEPQFPQNIAQHLQLNSGILDPLGFDLTPSSMLYFELLDNMAKAFETCLTPQG